jgi:tRNA (guanine-N7-)-methyltransferase
VTEDNPFAASPAAVSVLVERAMGALPLALPLAAAACVADSAAQLRGVPPTGGPLEVEIGCGNGHFLSEYAAGRPRTRLIGIDIKEKRCLKARQKVEKRGLANVSIVHGAAEAFLLDLAPGSVDAFHIYFPDPWPKSRHRKRRFFTMERLRQLHAGLRDGGRLYFGTDFFDYYIQAKVLVALHGGFRITAEQAPEAVLTSLYAQRFTGQDKTIHIFTAVRVPSPDEQEQQDEEDRCVHDNVERYEEG